MAVMLKPRYNLRNEWGKESHKQRKKITDESVKEQGLGCVCVCVLLQSHCSLGSGSTWSGGKQTVPVNFMAY